MDFKCNTGGRWRRWRFAAPHLPSHLPRLVLPPRVQPRYVRQCDVTQELLPLLQRLDWDELPATHTWRCRGERTVPLAAYVGAYLVKLERQLPTFGALRRFLREHPALIWALGFPLIPQRGAVGGFDPDASLPSHAHLTRKLAQLPNDLLQALLDAQVTVLKHQCGDDFGRVISLDTKHILAWVKENNPKAYLQEEELGNRRQPAGDKDCKLGCKRRTNQIAPTKEGTPPSNKFGAGEYYWGYASGVAATKVDGLGEFILAECTLTFDRPELAYFFPLMERVEQRLGFRPPYATADAAFDAFYVYDYFHRADGGGFAAVPLRQVKSGLRHFDAAGLPLCAAGLAMPLGGTFINRTSMVQHQRGRYLCPLVYPDATDEACPIGHPNRDAGGCKLVMPTAEGARIRYQLDRESEAYQQVYRQRTAVERIFSQAVNLGIERPKLRNQAAIANANTLIYLLINLHAMARLDQS